MPYCVKCGAQLVDNAKFCQKCGQKVDVVINAFTSNPEPQREAQTTPPPIPEPVQTKNESDASKAQRQQEYAGKIIKCPNCGETINSYISNCPSCGYEIRVMQATYSIQQFFSEMNHALSNEQKAQLIRNFPIPNAKEDILEFMIMASSNIYAEQDRVLFEAWCVKFEQSYQKAELTLQNDKSFIKIQELYDNTYKEIHKERAKQVGRAVTKGSGYVGKFFLSLIKSTGALVSVVLFVWAVKIDTSGDNSSLHELVGVILLIASSAALLRHNSTFIEIFIVAASGVLSMLLATFLWNGSMLELGGAVALILVAIAFFKRLTKKNT